MEKKNDEVTFHMVFTGPNGHACFQGSLRAVQLQKAIFLEVTFHMVFTGPSGLPWVQKDTKGTAQEETRA